MSVYSTTHFTAAELAERGWTTTLIKQFAGRSDLNVWLGAGRATRIYARKRILEIEASPAFVEAKGLRQTRYARSAVQLLQIEYKRQRILDLANSLPMPSLPIPFAEVSLTSWRLRPSSTKPLSPDRVAVEYLLGTMDSVGGRLNTYVGHTGIREARAVLRKRCLEHIRECYPMLSLEVSSMLADRREGQT